jgi:hypothetical protein
VKAFSLLFVFCLAFAALGAQRAEPSLDEILARMDAYLEAYESQLTAITADERYEQREILLKRETIIGQPIETANASTRRRMESDVAFVRLPGSGEWAGFRDVHRVDGKVIKAGGPTLGELLARGSDVFLQASAMTTASSRFNLGAPRTTNMPTVPLELLHPRHRTRFRHRLAGAEAVREVRTVRVIFEELQSPTVIKRAGDGADIKANGTAWVEADSGRIWRVELRLEDSMVSQRSWSAGRMRVEFDLDPRLNSLVPVEMTEIFDVLGGRGEGKATYTNFKRFETGARIVP